MARRYTKHFLVEERLNAKEQDKYFKVPMDERDLNYDQFFEKGNVNYDQLEDYNLVIRIGLMSMR